MIKHGKLVLLAGLIVPGMALAQMNLGDTLGASDDEIRAALEAKGYVISEIEREDGEIEVEVTLDGMAYEIEISAATGEVIEIELEDDDASEDS